MDELGADEIFFILVAGLVGFFTLIRFYRDLLQVWTGRTTAFSRLALALLPPISILLLFYVLQRWGDALQVNGHPFYIALFIVGLCAWQGLTTRLVAAWGINIRGDVLERRNAAAAIFIGGAIFGTGLLYTFCNVGAGPTIWTTIVPAGVGTAVLVIVAWIALWPARIINVIVIDRDIPTAMRHMGLWITGGIILGRAMAGDWISWQQTFTAFCIQGAPVLFLMALTMVLDALLRPTPQEPRPSVLSSGVAPVFIDAAITTVWLIYLGPWQANGRTG